MKQTVLFGTLADGKQTHLYELVNANGMRALITDYGAAVISLFAPDRKGDFADVVLGYDELTGYVNDTSYLGVIVGRCGNRIREGRFSLNGKAYQLTVNQGEDHLHGGDHGFHKVVWTARPEQSTSRESVTLAFASPDGDEGYPGNVHIEVTYMLNEKNEFVVDYRGSTDRTTLFNPTHHSYFNLTGDLTNTILDHHLQIESDSFTAMDKDLITTGEILSVANTPLDFRTPTAIGLRINEPYGQLVFGKGYDHNWILRDWDRNVRKVAELYEPKSGRVMTVSTDQPGMQFYSGNFLDGTARGKGGIAYRHRVALCLETQHFPDAPNKPHFPSVTLMPGEVYRQTTRYAFSTK